MYDKLLKPQQSFLITLYMLMLGLRIKWRERDVHIRESGGGSKLDGRIRIALVGRHNWYEWIDRKETRSWEVLQSVQLDAIICMNELTERRQGHGKYYDQSFECESFVCESSWPLCRKDGSRPVCVCVCVCVHGCKPLVFPSTMHATLFYHCDNFQPQRPTSPAVDSNTDFFVLISHFALEWNDENLDGHH